MPAVGERTSGFMEGQMGVRQPLFKQMNSGGFDKGVAGESRETKTLQTTGTPFES